MGANYAGDPGSFPDEVYVVDDSDDPTAAAFGPGFQGPLDRTAWLRARMTYPGQNWLPQVEFSTTVTTEDMNAASWAPLSRYWLIGCSGTVSSTLRGDVYVSYGVDGNTTYFSGNTIAHFGSGPVITDGTTTPLVSGVVEDPTTKGAAWAATLTGHAGGPYNGNATSPSVLTISTCASSSSAWSAQRVVTVLTGLINCQLATFKGLVIYALATVGALSSQTLSTWNGSAWIDFVPSGHMTNSPWILKENGSSVLAVSFGGNEGGAFTTAMFSSTDGVTWTSSVLSFLAVADAVRGLAWVETKNVWVLAVETIGSVGANTMAFWSSPDGVTWTSIGPGPAGFNLSDLASLGGVLLANTFEATTNGPSILMWSPNMGLTWYPGSGFLTANGSSVGVYYQRPRFAEGDDGLLQFNMIELRWSARAGLPEAL